MRKTFKTVARYAAVFLCVFVLLLAQMNPQPVKAVGAVAAGTYMTWALLCLLAACGVTFAVDSTGAITQATQDTITAFQDNLARRYPEIYVAVEDEVSIAIADFGSGDEPPEPNDPVGFGEVFLVMLTATLAPLLMSAVRQFFGNASADGEGEVVIISTSHTYTATSTAVTGTVRTNVIGSESNKYRLYEGDSLIIYADGSLTAPKVKMFNTEVTVDGQYFGDGTFTPNSINNIHTDEIGRYTDVYLQLTTALNSGRPVLSSTGISVLNISAGLSMDDSRYNVLGSPGSSYQPMYDWTYNLSWGTSNNDGEVYPWQDVQIYDPVIEWQPFIEGSPLRDSSNVPYIPIEVDPSHPPEYQTDPLTDADLARLIELYPEINPTPGTGTDPDPGTDPNPGTDPAADPYPTTDFISPPSTATQDDVDDFKAPSLIFTRFPFCIPWDLYHAFSVLQAEAVVPVFTFNVPVDYSIIGGTDEEYEIVLDLSEYDLAITVFRWCLLVTFVVGLVLVTRKLIGN